MNPFFSAWAHIFVCVKSLATRKHRKNNCFGPHVSENMTFSELFRLTRETCAPLQNYWAHFPLSACSFFFRWCCICCTLEVGSLNSFALGFALTYCIWTNNAAMLVFHWNTCLIVMWSVVRVECHIQYPAVVASLQVNKSWEQEGSKKVLKEAALAMSNH